MSKTWLRFSVEGCRQPANVCI